MGIFLRALLWIWRRIVDINTAADVLAFFDLKTAFTAGAGAVAMMFFGATNLDWSAPTVVLVSILAAAGVTVITVFTCSRTRPSFLPARRLLFRHWSLSAGFVLTTSTLPVPAVPRLVIIIRRDFQGVRGPPSVRTIACSPSPVASSCSNWPTLPHCHWSARNWDETTDHRWSYRHLYSSRRLLSLFCLPGSREVPGAGVVARCCSLGWVRCRFVPLVSRSLRIQCC